MRAFSLSLLAALPLIGQSTADRQLAIQALHQWRTVCKPYGMQLWGKSLCGPVVLVNPETRVAIANQPDPSATFHAEDGVYVGVLPHELTPSSTPTQWAGQVWTMILMPLPDDPFLRDTSLAHEAFHRIQPSLRLMASDKPAECLDTEAGRVWMRLEMRALARAMSTKGDEQMRSATDAMLFRLYRDQLCPGTARAEGDMEKQEGLPQYTGAWAALRETGDTTERVAKDVESYDNDAQFSRTFGYAIGPPLGLLLDRYAAGWRRQIAQAPSMDDLLVAALHLQAPADLQQLAKERAGSYGYEQLAAEERAREEQHQTLLSELKRKFVDGPTLRLPAGGGMRRFFRPPELVPFPPYGVYYPTGTFLADWGKLQVDSGGALVAEDYSNVKVSAPNSLAGQPIHGNGWTLGLAPGWTVQPVGNGSFAVVRAPIVK
jgi:hypothetical protein